MPLSRPSGIIDCSQLFYLLKYTILYLIHKKYEYYILSVRFASIEVYTSELYEHQTIIFKPQPYSFYCMM